MMNSDCMKTVRFLCGWVLVWVMMPLGVSAQRVDPLERYEQIPDAFQQVFNDYLEENDTRLITTGQGQFLGHTRDGLLYGYGVYYANDGSQWIGQYRKGECIFGLLISGNYATIGSKLHYVYYDLTTSLIKFVRQSGNDRLVSDEEASDYHFESLNYGNGDRYVGETYKGNKHGYGIYYWANGNYWYGQYRNNMRYGYGALFTPKGNIYVGKWIGDEKVE